MVNLNLTDPVTKLATVSPAFAENLRRGLGIYSINDLLWHLPSRYEDFSTITPIKNIQIGQQVNISGKILSIEKTRTWKKRMSIIEALVSDNTDSVKLVWFNQPWIEHKLNEGKYIFASGKYTAGKNGNYIGVTFWENIYTEPGRSVEAPEIVIEKTEDKPLLAIYPETEGITSRWLRYIIAQALKRIGEISETLPQEVITKGNLLDINLAIRQAHAPKNLDEANKAIERLSFEEMFLIQCATLQSKLRMSNHKAAPIQMDVELIKDFLGRLPWELTQSQRKSAFQVLKDMEKTSPMNRLIIGEVGSGKTLVAALAMLNAARSTSLGQTKSGWQSVIMAPTEILAQQHFKELARLLTPFKLRIGLFTGSTSKITPKRLTESSMPIAKPKLFKEIKNGEIDVLVGTHALISKRAQGKSTRSTSSGQATKSSLLTNEPLRFKKLGLAIVDEQHRFGVEQRSILSKMQQELHPKPYTLYPHFLTMTATPIPRSLALTIFGDLDLSLMNDLPQTRKPITTEIIPIEEINKIYELVRKEIIAGHQAFIVYPLVKKSDKMALKAAEIEYEKIAKEIFPELRVGLLHGQMKAKEKDETMSAFKKGKIVILVATTVIEVGIDVPNATVMVIEGADRFGLAQLHQLRGRIGRGEYESKCFLIIEKGGNPSTSLRAGSKRLKAFERLTSGPELAQKDLEIRGPGEILGTRQAGLSEIILKALKDVALVEKSRETAKEFLRLDPNMKQYPQLSRRIAKISANLHLS